MKIAVIIPSEEQKAQAGVRIRYERIRTELVRQGHELELIPIQHLVSIPNPSHDIYLISKCYDARAILAAESLRTAGIPVGVDLFDDYFSQLGDSRFVRLRYWLRSIVQYCTFILCSTSSMQEVAKLYAPHLPSHVMNDPADPFNPQTLSETLQYKLDSARSMKRIEVAWFGMGDNPYFPVGLTDLAANGAEIDRMRGHGYEVNLSILTNLRAMTADNLMPLTRLATTYTIEEWTPERETRLLNQSLISFLPVNAQSFSRVKSLNRAITALTSGTQVFSVGYPLYKPLDPFIYRCPRRLIGDLDKGALALRLTTIPAFREKIFKLADIKSETNKLLKFFNELNSFKNLGALRCSRLAVIHGRESLSDIHKYAQKKKIISVASPFCKLDLNFDVLIRCDESGKLMVMVNKKIFSMLDESINQTLISTIKKLDAEYLIIDAFSDATSSVNSLVQIDTPSTLSAAYPVVMNNVVEILLKIFPNIHCIISEQTKRIPWMLHPNPRSELLQ